MDTEHFKEKLEQEQRLLETEMQTVGRKNPDIEGEWEPQPKDTDTASTEPDEKADKFEEYEDNADILDALQVRWRNVKLALEKISNGTYGVCEVSGEPIEADRLEINPAARTCEQHMAEEKDLPV